MGSKVVHSITLLGGKAQSWGAAFWELGHPATATITDEIKQVFDRSSMGHTTACQLTNFVSDKISNQPLTIPLASEPWRPLRGGTRRDSMMYCRRDQDELTMCNVPLDLDGLFA